MPFDIPEVPAGIVTLISFFLPYVQAILQRPGWSTTQKRVLSVVLSLVVTAVAMLVYYFGTGDVLPAWPIFILIALGAAQLSYGLVTRETASKVESTVNAGEISR